jgi:hypothetical protein
LSLRQNAYGLSRRISLIDFRLYPSPTRGLCQILVVSVHFLLKKTKVATHTGDTAHLQWRTCLYRMFHLKRNPNYNSICKFWWHQYNKTNELCFSFYLLRSTYRTASQQMLKMITTFSKTNIHPKFCYQSVYCYVIRYFLVGMRIAKWDFRFSRWRVWRWLPSGILRRIVLYKLTDVSEALTASIIDPTMDWLKE